MIPALSREDGKRLRETLVASHQVRITVNLTDLVGNFKRDLSDTLLGGQVDVDVTAEVSRVCTVELFDPHKSLLFASGDPDEAGLYMHKMIQIIYSVRRTNDEAWIDIPVFTGPIVKADRDDDTVHIEAQGKELLAKAPLWRPFVAKKGASVGDTIERLLVFRAGEKPTNLDLGAPKARLNKDYTFVELAQNPWDAAKKLAQADDLHLFYDGAGVARLRRPRTSHGRTFTDGDQGELMSKPVITFDATEAKNAVVVKGGKQKGEAIVDGRAVLPRTDPLNPWAIGRKNGESHVPRYLPEVIENDKITSQKKAEEIADKRLKRLSMSQVSVQFESVPIPYLEEYDPLTLAYGGYVTKFFARQFSIPLTVGETMSVGYNRRMRARRRNQNKTKRGRK